LNADPSPNIDEAFKRLRNELTARFARICCQMTPEDFHILMNDMAHEQIRGENAGRWR
jgi:hypothetical protein